MKMQLIYNKITSILDYFIVSLRHFLLPPTPPPLHFGGGFGTLQVQGLIIGGMLINENRINLQ